MHLLVLYSTVQRCQENFFFEVTTNTAFRDSPTINAAVLIPASLNNNKFSDALEHFRAIFWEGLILLASPTIDDRRVYRSHCDQLCQLHDVYGQLLKRVDHARYEWSIPGFGVMML